VAKRFLVIAIFVFGIAPAYGVELLSADLAFNFVCKETPRDDVERQTELFLKARNFKVLNLARIQHEHSFHLFDTNIAALDQDRRIVDMKSVPGSDQTYSFYLYSRPPTNHSASLEDSILDFVSDTLKCNTRQIERHENEKERQEFYESQVRRVEGLFEEADRINTGPRR
jgi:hypothetical protein